MAMRVGSIDSNTEVVTQDDLDDFEFNGSISLGAGAILTPATLSSNQDDYDPTGFRVSGEIVKSVLRIDCTADVEITGIVPSATATVNIVTISNISASKKIKLKKPNGGSAVANRFLFKADVTIEKTGAYTIYYDTTSLMWRPYNDPQ